MRHCRSLSMKVKGWVAVGFLLKMMGFWTHVCEGEVGRYASAEVWVGDWS